MRETFADQLAELENRMIDHLAAAANTLATVAVAIEHTTAQRAALLALDAQTLRERVRRLHADLVALAARQTPVAGDLRLLMGVIETAHHTTLIANQFEQISEQLWVTHLAVIDRLGATQKLARMCALASGQLQKAAIAFHTRDLTSARQIDRDDDTIDQLNREIFETTAQTDLPAEERELALRHVLIARCLERVADNAVDIAEQAAFVMTAELQEFSDASQPRRRT